MDRKHAHHSTPDDDIPEMTKEDFARAKSVREHMPGLIEAMKRLRGRPKSAAPKERVSLRLDPKILAAYKATGPGWQRRIADTLARAAPRAKHKKRSSRAA
jgi:uncharacterized protein (DUF4415 family)